MKNRWKISLLVIIILAAAVGGYYLNNIFGLGDISRVREVSVDEVKQKLGGEEKILIFDARSSREYEVGHLPQAISLPANLVTAETVSEYDRETEVITYCSNEACDLADKAANKLVDLGFTDVGVMKTGLVAFDPTLVESLDCVAEDGAICEEISGRSFDATRLSTVLVVGLLDGVNPCAIGMLIFVLGYLIVFAGSKKKILVVGLLYIAVVFGTYLTLGLIFQKSIEALLALPAYFTISLIINLVFGIGLIAAGIINIKDFFWYGKGVTLRIPVRAGSFLKSIAEKATYPAIAILAVLVTLFEAPCSLPLYLGTVKILNDSFISNVSVVEYLLLYNLMFVLPLIVVLLLVKLTKNMVEVKEREHEARKWMKLSMGIALVVLGVVLLV